MSVIILLYTPFVKDQTVRIPTTIAMIIDALMSPNLPELEVKENITARASRITRVTPVQNRYLSL